MYKTVSEVDQFDIRTADGRIWPVMDPAHEDWVIELAKQLMADGVDIELDKWSTKEGHDLNHYMEQMANDPTITRVICICDKLYAQKANARKGGVGTESQIISKEVYERVNQEKFLPVVKERDEDGKPCLPTFFGSRKYFDFSNSDNYADEYEKLLRNILDRPALAKPPLGSPPTHIMDDAAVSVSSAGKAKRFKDFVINAKGNPSAAFEDFVDGFVTDLEDLRISYSQDQEKTWCQTLFDNIGTAAAHRDVYVDAISAGAKHVRDDWFIPAMHSLLEKLLPFRSRPQHLGSSYRTSEDNFKFIVYELFLYTFAAFIKARRYSDARSLIDAVYVAPEHLDEGGGLQSNDVGGFNSYTDQLETTCAERDRTRRLSVMGDLLHERATRSDIRFTDLLQADILCWLAVTQWYPKSFVYAGRAGKLELFARALNESGFAPLKTLLNITTPQQLLEEIINPKLARLAQSERLFHARVDFSDLMNLREFARVWRIGDPE